MPFNETAYDQRNKLMDKREAQPKFGENTKYCEKKYSQKLKLSSTIHQCTTFLDKVNLLRGKITIFRESYLSLEKSS